MPDTLSEIIAKAKERNAALIASMPDERAKQYFMVFPEWAHGREFAAGQRIRVGKTLYRVLKDHTADSTRKPGSDPALYQRLE